MDTTTLVLGAATVVFAVTAVAVILHARRLSRSIDHALARIDGRPATRWWRRAATLDREVRVLEDRVAHSERDRARLAAAVAEAPIGVVLTDDAGVVLFANDAASAYLGARHGEAVAEDRIRRTIESAILRRTVERREFEIYTPQRRHLDVRTVPLEHGVESLGAVAYIVDVSEPRRVDAMRSDFIANASHELKTPLGALSVLAETLADQSDDPAVVGRMAARVLQEARRLSDLVDDLLDLSQAEAAERPREPVGLTEVVTAAAEGLAASAAERSVTVQVAGLPGNAPVWGDRRQLHILFTNLIENAVKHGASGDPDRPARVAVTATTDREDVIVSIEDEGPGIAEPHLERIFERFYRIDRGRSRDTGGTGLGLSIARHIARNHGGDITVESQVGIGTVFRVRLPVWREP